MTKKEDEILEKFTHPQEIFDLRTKLGLSQLAFAVKLGTNPTSVCRWENGHTVPEKYFRLKMASL